jgi:hypothetical protein
MFFGESRPHSLHLAISCSSSILYSSMILEYRWSVHIEHRKDNLYSFDAGAGSIISEFRAGLASYAA